MNRLLIILLLSVLPWFLGPSGIAAGQGKASIVNFAHLRHLTERIAFQGDSVSIVHVYADAPSYNWTDAGDEGIACVDDAGRAAVVYLRHYLITRDETSLAEARSLLKFILKMEDDNGLFCNFILKDHSVNMSGQTSFRSFGWWAARAVWSMGLGYRVFRDRDPGFASTLKRGIDLVFPHIDSLLLDRRIARTKGFRIPQWLLYKSGADATSELMLGLVEYSAAVRNPGLETTIGKLADGLMAMQDGDIRVYPYGVHRSWETSWHLWGNSQTQALASAGNLLHKKTMVNSARLEADGFYSRLLIEGLMKEQDLADPRSAKAFEQIAYGIRPMTVGLLRLYEATHRREYLAMAGLAASWLTGNNVLHQTMYDPSTGRCYDGIRDSATVNRNSGAESTIEALLTLVELERYPEAIPFLHMRKAVQGHTGRYEYAQFADGSGHQATLAIDLRTSRLLFLEGHASRAFQRKVAHRR